MKPKHTVRALKKYVKEYLKENTYYALEKTFKPFIDEESGEWKTGFVVEHKVNHGRRVKKVFNKFGINAAIAYLTYYKNEENNSITTNK